MGLLMGTWFPPSPEITPEVWKDSWTFPPTDDDFTDVFNIEARQYGTSTSSVRLLESDSTFVGDHLNSTRSYWNIIPQTAPELPSIETLGSTTSERHKGYQSLLPPIQENLKANKYSLNHQRNTEIDNDVVIDVTSFQSSSYSQQSHADLGNKFETPDSCFPGNNADNMSACALKDTLLEPLDTGQLEQIFESLRQIDGNDVKRKLSKAICSKRRQEGKHEFTNLFSKIKVKQLTEEDIKEKNAYLVKNREASNRCRKKKDEKKTGLEKEIQRLGSEKEELSSTINDMRLELKQLTSMFQQHCAICPLGKK